MMRVIGQKGKRTRTAKQRTNVVVVRETDEARLYAYSVKKNGGERSVARFLPYYDFFFKIARGEILGMIFAK
jgi:hypothetical protein